MAETMVVGVDGTADSLAALGSAAELAEESGAALIVVHVRHEGAVASAGSVAAHTEVAMIEALDEVERASRERVADVLAGRTVPWRFEVVSGDPATELIAVALDQEATTIIVGGRNHGVVGGLVAGSVAQKLVRRSPVSVLVVRDGQAHRLDVTSAVVSGSLDQNRSAE
jgi:nucleotide-binding universal stress UspA family protein